MEVIYLILGISLLVCTITDITSKKINILFVISVSIILFLLRFFYGEMGMYCLVGVLLIWFLTLFIGWVSGGQIGSGDAFIFAMIGAGLGLWDEIFVLIISFLGAFIAAIFLMIFRRKGKKYKMPLAPFITGSYMIYLVNCL